MQFYSQFGQDSHALFSIYKGKRNGYFVEVGAYDGIESSNCLTMEKDFDWKGIAIECSPSKFALLQKNRNCICVPYAVYKEDNEEMEFFDSGGHAGLVKTNHHSHILKDRKIKVQTKNLTTLLREANAPAFIEYLSLDTEGSEYDILASHDFTQYLFGYICVEHNHVDANRKKIRSFLESKGYVFTKVNGSPQWGEIDDEYIHQSLLTQTQKKCILFINSTIPQCGVYQYGKRLYNQLISKEDSLYNYVYIELNSLTQYTTLLHTINALSNVHAILYNYHHSTLPWLNAQTICNDILSIGIPHESQSNFFQKILDIDPSVPNGLPRPLLRLDPTATIHPEFQTFISFREEDTPVFGTFGFGFTNKGYDKIVKVVSQQYEKAIIKFLIPMAHFHNNAQKDIETIRNLCVSNLTNSNIKLVFLHNFVTDQEVLHFLESNDLNVFLYDEMPGRGNASTTDYALSVNTPIAISKSYMFRHIYTSALDATIHSLEECKANCKKHEINSFFQNLWTVEAIQARVHNVLV